jgi:serine/threonine-protein kinase
MKLRISLGTRIFALTALVVALAVLAAVAVTYVQGDRIAHETARQALDRANSVQAVLQQQRFDQLALIAKIFADDTALTSYVAEAIDSGNTLSVLDQLEDRQGDLGFDFGIILDGDGFLVARTDDPEATGDDLADRPLVSLALDQFQGSGVWEQDGRLFHAVAAPLTLDRLLIGFFVAGFAIDDLTAVEVSRTSETEVAFLSRGEDGVQLVATTLQAGLSSELMNILGNNSSVAGVMERGQPAEQLQLQLAGAQWIGLMRPLQDADGGVVGAALALTSLDKQLQPFVRIERTLAIVGLAAILLASLLSFLLSQRVMRPVRDLAKVATAASAGDYDQKVDVSRSDEVGQLAASFDALLSELREKQDMEAYIGNLSKSLGTGREDEKPLEVANARELALMAVELRGYALGKVTRDPEESLANLGRDLRLVSRVVEERKGRIEGVFGHRLVASFAGLHGAYRALTASTELSSLLAAESTAFDDIPAPVIAMVRGEVVSGSVVWGDGPQRMVVGRPFLLLDGLLREATPGEVAMSPDLYEELADSFDKAGMTIKPQRGLLGSQTLYVLSAKVAAKVTGEVPIFDSMESVMQTRATSPIQLESLSDVAPGRVLGDRFEILGMLGAGGMGVVYKVRDRELDDLVALKMLKQEVYEKPEHLDRLKSELKLARKITHPNVLRTFDFGEIGGLPFISMEYVRGITLRQVMDETGALPYSAGLRLARQLCRGLAAAHDVGVLHRDIKPENLIVEANGNAKLMDFGIARPIERQGPGHTQEGFAVGTPQYMAPEQLQGQTVDHRADLFAVGVVLFEIFTNHVPFKGSNPIQVAMSTMKDEPIPPRELWPEMPIDLERTILRCLEKDVSKRYPDARTLLADLERLRA